MKIKEALADATTKLTENGISTARLDCLILLEDITKLSRTSLIAHDEDELTDVTLQQFMDLISTRSSHVPLAQLRGHCEFYGRDFIVTKDVLQPRPESEDIIEILLTIDLPKDVSIADVGSGSGALGITAKLELPEATVELLEIDTAARRISGQNAVNLQSDVTITESDLLTDARSEFQVLLCNLPYVPIDFPINKAAQYEPSVALFSGVDGLDLYRRLFEQVERHTEIRHILTESLPTQHEALKALAQTSGFNYLQQRGFIQYFTR